MTDNKLNAVEEKAVHNDKIQWQCVEFEWRNGPTVVLVYSRISGTKMDKHFSKLEWGAELAGEPYDTCAHTQTDSYSVLI